MSVDKPNDYKAKPEVPMSLPEDVTEAAAQAKEAASEDAAKALTEAPAERKAGTLHESYKKVAESHKDKLTQDKDSLKKATVEDIRRKSKLLKPVEEPETDETSYQNTKEETARRLNAYTQEENGWHKLDYEQFGADTKGKTHERNIGLGDILLDPSIKKVLVQKDGEMIEGTRGIVASGRHKGRVGFLNEEGKYLYTHTGDKFKILSDEDAEQLKPEKLKAWSEELKAENKQREEHEISYESNSETSYFSSSEVVFDQDYDSIADQLDYSLFRANHREKAKEMATLIEEEFTKALNEHPKLKDQPEEIKKRAIKNIVAAAIINAIAESGLNPDAVGDSGNSVGLFQLNSGGAGHGMSLEERKDSLTNVRTILEREVLAGGGKNLISQAIKGASPSKLAAIFSRDVERPRDTEGAMRTRERMTAKYFRNSAKEVQNTAEHVQETFDGNRGVINYKRGETLILGSSSVKALNNKVDGAGIMGWVGAGPDKMHKALNSGLWNKIAHLKPKKVVLMGLAVNGMNQNSADTERITNNAMESYEQIIKFLKSQGVEEVKISVMQPFEHCYEQRMAFNEKLKAKYGEQVIDPNGDLVGENGKIKPEYVSGDGYHLTNGGPTIYGKKIAEAIKPKSS